MPIVASFSLALCLLPWSSIPGHLTPAFYSNWSGLTLTFTWPSDIFLILSTAKYYKRWGRSKGEEWVLPCLRIPRYRAKRNGVHNLRTCRGSAVGTCIFHETHSGLTISIFLSASLTYLARTKAVSILRRILQDLMRMTEEILWNIHVCSLGGMRNKIYDIIKITRVDRSRSIDKKKHD